MIKTISELINLIIKSITLDSKTYISVKESNRYLRYSALFVVIGSLAAGFGTYSYTNQAGILKQIVSSILGWFLLSSIIYFIGVKIFSYGSDYKQILRLIGIAYSPMLLNILAFIPSVGSFIIFISSIWLFFTTVYAVKHAFECTRIAALLVVLSSIVPYVIIFILIF